MIDAIVQQNMTQKDLSAKTGITQADISRIENGMYKILFIAFIFYYSRALDVLQAFSIARTKV